MTFVAPLLLILGSLITMSSFIIARTPSAKDLFAKVAPYQGFVGIGLLVFGAYAFYYYTILDEWGGQTVLGMYWHGVADSNVGRDMRGAVSLIGLIACCLLIGFMLGFGLIAAMTPGEGTGEKIGLQIQRKLLTLALPLGIAGIVFALLWLTHHPYPV